MSQESASLDAVAAMVDSIAGKASAEVIEGMYELLEVGDDRSLREGLAMAWNDLEALPEILRGVERDDGRKVLSRVAALCMILLGSSVDEKN